jgi:Domain of unknown function (DUF4389)
MYPVTFEAQNPGPGRNRLTVLLRYFITIPWAIWSAIYGLVAGIVAFIAWFALLFTARYPQGMYDFVAKYIRYQSRYGAFAYLMTDEYPPFNGEEDPSYPVSVGIAPPKESYSRLKVFFRFIVGIPVILMALVHIIILAVCAVIGWFAILFTGELSEGLYNPIRSAMIFLTRTNAYFSYLTEDWPPFSPEEGSGTAGQLPGSAPPAAPPLPSAPEAGQQPQPPAGA